MRKYFVLCVAALLLVATAAFAAEEETGRIVSIDPVAGTFSIETDDGDRILYRAEPSTRMMRGGATVELGDLAVGTRVTVSAAEAEGSGPRLASQVTFAAADADDAGTRTTGQTGDPEASGERLPSTASPLPLIALLGAGAVAAALLFRRMRR